MSITNYAELKAAVADFLNRQDLTATIPTFIALAEARLNRDIRHWRMEVRAEADFDERYEGLPADWLEGVRVGIVSDSELRNVGPRKMQEMHAESSTAGKPCYFAIVGQQFEFYPVPDQAYSGEMVYYSKIPALSDASTTNWLLQNAPDVYLYGTLMHTAPYLGDDDRLTWAALYQSGIDELNQQSMVARLSGSALVMK